MRVAVFSDVQANLPAMEAATEDILGWRPDLVVMAGDLVNRGPSSRDCLARFESLHLSHGWLPVRGNHEAWVLRCGRERPRSEPDAQLRRFADFAFRQIGDMAGFLMGWPDHLCFQDAAGQGWVHVTHGSMAGNRDGISASVPDADLEEKLPADVALFVSAHTHKPMTRHFRGMDILNVGSVGAPFDGDTRASYGRLEWHGGRWHTGIMRLPYDRRQTERDFQSTGFLDEGGPLARIIVEEWRSARLLMPIWHRRYRRAVQAGDIDPGRAVDDFLSSLA